MSDCCVRLDKHYFEQYQVKNRLLIGAILFLLLLNQYSRVGFIVAFMLMLLNATFNNISVISWQTVLLVEETGETTDLSQVT